MRAGETVAGLEGHAALTEAELDATERIVAMAGVHPFIELLRTGRRRDHRRPQQRQLRVRRAGDPSRLSRGPGVLPRQGARVRVVLRRALRRQGDGARRDQRGRRRGHRDASRRSAAPWRRSPDTRCTSARIRTSSTSPAARSTCRSAATSRSTRRPRASPARSSGAPPEFRVKLEGAGKVGERYVGMVGIRDPYTIAHVDEVIGWARDKVRERFGETTGYELHYTVYGRDGVMGELEPMRDRPGARALHPRAGRRADRGDGRGGLHDRHAADVLRATARREGLGGLGRVRARRGAAREPRATAGRSTTRCAATIRSSSFRRT